MTAEPALRYKRVLLKISGEALMGEQGYGIDVPAVTKYAEEVKSAIALGCQICLVIGGGNIWRGKWGVDATAKPSLAGYTPRHRVPPEVWKRLALKDYTQ